MGETVATSGTLLSYGYDPSAQTFVMSATAAERVRRGARAEETVVYIPAQVRGAVHVTGAAVVDTVVRQPDGSRLAYVAPIGPGSYGVGVAG